MSTRRLSVKRVSALGGALAAGIGSPVWALSAAPCATGAARPQITGQLAFQVGDGDSASVYYLDFQSGDAPRPTKIPLGDADPSKSVFGATNPTFSPDGKAIVFAANFNNVEHDIYYWPINSPSPGMNLTPSTGLSNEDVKFSPDGTKMVWKQNGGIVVAPFSYDANGQPVLGQAQRIVPGDPSSGPNEASGPVFTPSGASIFFYIGHTKAGGVAPEFIHRYDVAGGTITMTPFAEDPSRYYYYPMVGTASTKLFYTNGIGFDQISAYANADAISGAATTFNGTDTEDNSDPTPVNGDLFIFSRDHNAADGDTAYELYLGQWSTNQCWTLTSWVSFPGEDVVGAAFNPPLVTSWSLGGANYRPALGGVGSAVGSGRPQW
jgi:Tol biopolymer transport system component